MYTRMPDRRQRRRSKSTEIHKETNGEGNKINTNSVHGLSAKLPDLNDFWGEKKPIVNFKNKNLVLQIIKYHKRRGVSNTRKKKTRNTSHRIYDKGRGKATVGQLRAGISVTYLGRVIF